ncbi:MAG: mannose-1-phosphate guanylyltransferase/mannose-6-phosphate isomerase [Gammaproteobacteria bacterium]|nr:mannose-1-phosphate guanylyltransferase/mannose-6-phosphate isomerase [Gammaproteobacteria bacterium]
MNIVPIILAGGGGTRLWPLSRGHYPKQFLSVVPGATLLQGTLLRVAEGPQPIANLQRPMVVCHEEHRFLVGEQARVAGHPFETILLEPSGRNTAPALTTAALRCASDGADPLLLMMPSDHLVQDPAAFRRAVCAGAEHAAAGLVVTFGVVPSSPETGYGYIQLGAALANSAPAVHHIAAFREKPALETAQEYLASGEYRWNAGIFLLKTSVWLAAIGRYRPDILAACERATAAGSRDGEFFRPGKAAYAECPSDSIDYAVMERLVCDEPARTAVVSLDAGWSDVGSWSSLWQVLAKDTAGNVIRGDVSALECSNNLIFSESRLIAALGCENLVIVETADAVMVAPRERAQDVKAIVERLTQAGRPEPLAHRQVHRPWGSYEGVDSGDRFQVKRIKVKPGASLSLQMHHHRAEHWIVVKGTARVTRGDEVFLLSENQSTYIPLGAQHRLENPGAIPLEIIEVQSGAYLGEDDIVRFEDKYQRT